MTSDIEPRFIACWHGIDQPDRRPIEIRPLRNMLLRTMDGAMQHCDSGTEITVERWTLRQLDPVDFDLAAT